MIPALHALLVSASELGVRQAVLCMPHRGRLNVLLSLLHLEARVIFAKVAGRSLVPAGMWGDCDVLSHIAATSTRRLEGSRSLEPLTVSLLPNPSHLEAINPVALGRTRAEQELLQPMPEDERMRRVMCVQLHGDAAFSGQGVVAESLTLAYLRGFSVGGTVHIVVNNQVGFTAGRGEGPQHCLQLGHGPPHLLPRAARQRRRRGRSSPSPASWPLSTGSALARTS